MPNLNELLDFATAKPIKCNGGKEVVSRDELLKVSYGGRQILTEMIREFCQANCFDGYCQLAKLKERLGPIISDNTR